MTTRYCPVCVGVGFVKRAEQVACPDCGGTGRLNHRTARLVLGVAFNQSRCTASARSAKGSGSASPNSRTNDLATQLWRHSTMDRLQVGDLVRTDTGIVGRIATISDDGQSAYVPLTAEVDATLIRFDVTTLERIEPRAADQSPPHSPAHLITHHPIFPQQHTVRTLPQDLAVAPPLLRDCLAGSRAQPRDRPFLKRSFIDAPNLRRVGQLLGVSKRGSQLHVPQPQCVQMTETELRLIAAPAMIGLRSTPKNG